MKKTKLLMPILGVAATAGMIAPIAVACNKPEDKPEPGEQVEVTLDQIKLVDLEAATFTVYTSTVLPKAIVGEPYVAVITWTEYAADLLPVDDSVYASMIAYVGSKSNTIPVNIMHKGYNQVSFYIAGDFVTEGMHIELTVGRDLSSWSGNLNLPTYPGDSAGEGVICIDTNNVAKKVAGVSCTPFSGLEWYDNDISFSIELKKLYEALSKVKQDSEIANMQDLVIYAEGKNASTTNPHRIQPTWGGDVTIGEEECTVSYDWISESTYAMFIHLPHALTIAELKSDVNVTGYFNFAFNFAMDLNGGRFCCFDYRDAIAA